MTLPRFGARSSRWASNSSNRSKTLPWQHIIIFKRPADDPAKKLVEKPTKKSAQAEASSKNEGKSE